MKEYCDKIKLTKYNIVLDKKIIDEKYKTFIDSQSSYEKLKKDRVVKNSDKIFVNIKTADVSAPDFLKSQKRFKPS